MARNQQIDNLEYDALNFSYDLSDAPISTQERWVDGLNAYITPGGSLAKRPGVAPESRVGALLSGKNIHKAVSYSITTPTGVTKSYIVASVLSWNSTGNYAVYYIEATAATPAWTSIGSLRDVDASTFPHHLCVHNNKVYIRGYPASGSSEKLGTVIWYYDTTAAALKLVPWGAAGPTEPIHVSTPAGWGAASNAVTVTYGWKYTYAYVSITGHVTNRAPLETNPDLDPSDTGAFTNKNPEMVYVGLADTTNFPYVNIYRTTDGGGTFYFLEQITNPGSGNRTYIDDSLESGAGGGTFDDPVPDAYLDTSRVAPSLVSNSPPPTCISPGVVGTTTPQLGTEIVSFAGRLWYGIGNFLFYSSNEETADGVPEEAWNYGSGLVGNFYRLDKPLTQLTTTSTELIVGTTEHIQRLLGSNLETFALKPLVTSIGMYRNWFRSCAVSVNDAAYFLTSDLRVGRIRQGQFSIMSDPLLNTLNIHFADAYEPTHPDAPMFFSFAYDGQRAHDRLLINAWPNVTGISTRQYILDLRKTDASGKPFWYTPWGIEASYILSFSYNTYQYTGRKLLFAIPGASTGSKLMYLGIPANETSTDLGEQDTGYDTTVAGTTAGYSFYVNTHLMLIPTGNHVNTFRRPGLVPALYGVKMDRSLFDGDVDPRVYIYKDDFWTAPEDLGSSEVEPARRVQSKGYVTHEWMLNDSAYRVALRFEVLNSNTPVQIHSFAVQWNPEGGA